MSEIVSTLEAALRHQSPNVPPAPPSSPPPSPPPHSHGSHAPTPPSLSRVQPGYGGFNPEAIRLVHPDRATNCEIMLRKIGVPLHDIINAILALDSSGVIVDQVDDLIEICPTKDELELLKSYTGNKKMLGECEQFFFECAKIPRIVQKLHVFAFTTTFSSRVNNVRETLNIIKDATKEIRESTKLVAIMHTIHKMGNILNAGTDQGSAEGFKLHSLEKLVDTRATNQKITLLHYLCKVVAEQTPELLDFDKELIHLHAASMTHITSLQLDVLAIRKSYMEVQHELHASEIDGGVYAQFCKALKRFLDSAGPQLPPLTSFFNEVAESAHSLVVYFAEDSNRCTWEQVVSYLVRFIAMFKKAHNQNKQWAEGGSSY
ncbi:hypothetical protein L2E82_48475 [Cichorium intybus]|uniref:Uncharacterized protein n=1 Tax=Cichorium intybus TaxID=13427 RepID=A0ACB8YXF6_CICIN|nr:hypothetical protein L2E82_48475 [Cichorium intybus]